MLLGQQSTKVYIDHKNLTYKMINTEQVIQWILILKEYCHDLIYIQSSTNVTTDALSRFGIVDTSNPVKNNIKSVNEHYGLEDEDISDHIITLIQNQQHW